MFPEIEFKFGYSAHDVKLYTFLIHTSIREFYSQLKPLGFNAFEHPVKKIDVQATALPNCACIGQAKFFEDHIMLQLPAAPSALAVSIVSSIITHELGHHFVQEFYGDDGDGNRLGNNLIHVGENLRDDGYFYSRLYNSRVFVRKYLLPFANVRYPNIQRLIAEKDAIVASIAAGTAPSSPHELW